MRSAAAAAARYGRRQRRWCGGGHAALRVLIGAAAAARCLGDRPRRVHLPRDSRVAAGSSVPRTSAKTNRSGRTIATPLGRSAPRRQSLEAVVWSSPRSGLAGAARATLTRGPPPNGDGGEARTERTATARATRIQRRRAGRRQRRSARNPDRPVRRAGGAGRPAHAGFGLGINRPSAPRQRLRGRPSSCPPRRSASG